MPETCRFLKQNKFVIIGASGWLFKKKTEVIVSKMNSTVGIVTGYGMECPRLGFRLGHENLSSPKTA
jgi:hypothetical protein